MLLEIKEILLYASLLHPVKAVCVFIGKDAAPIMIGKTCIFLFVLVLLLILKDGLEVANTIYQNVFEPQLTQPNNVF